MLKVAGTPPWQIVCTPVILFVPLQEFTNMVREAVSEQPLASVTVTSIKALFGNGVPNADVSKVFVLTPVVCRTLLR